MKKQLRIKPSVSQVILARIAEREARQKELRSRRNSFRFRIGMLAAILLVQAYVAVMLHQTHKQQAELIRLFRQLPCVHGVMQMERQ